ncbi:MAG: glycogen synthase [Planctomycetales bacterium]|nr:glycogen synthase [Planctomycetales bacterium]
MRIVLTAAEAVPFAKTGGLGEVVSALSRELDRAGHDVTLILPFYPRLVARCRDVIPPIESTGQTVRLPVGMRLITAGVLRTRLPGTRADVLLIDQPEFFGRRQPYQDQRRDDQDYSDNCERFSFLCRAIVEVIRQMPEPPDVIHCHDWQTALVPVLIEHVVRPRGELLDTATVLAIHNLEVQGRFTPDKFEAAGLDEFPALRSELELGDELNLLRAGIASADQIITVSPTYAHEVQSAVFGHGLDEALCKRGVDLAGVLNGVDSTAWNPATDRFIASNYGVAEVARFQTPATEKLNTCEFRYAAHRSGVPAAKAICKAALQERTGLPRRGEVPVVGIVSRLVERKGIDLIVACAESLLREDIQLVVLGQGDKLYQAWLTELAEQHPAQVSVTLARNESLAHQIFAGADLILMPSRVEPAGLNQLLAQIYGTPPIVRSVGGLADSVIDATPEHIADGTATGFVFEAYDSRACELTIRRALHVYHDRAAWSKLVYSTMQTDWSWRRSAEQYVRLYDQATERCRTRSSDMHIEYNEERIAV